nr:quinone-dependent dihydroorotate dehydrogenase [Conexibacter sp. W3-3-2]
MIWRALFRLVLVRVDAETAHRLGTVPLRLAGRLPGLARLLGPRDPRLQVRAFGLTFPSPVGLAAGFDKDAELVDGLLALGFGSVEVGTVTAEGQPGNPRPRLVRLPADRALVNRMGFNNRGAAVAEGRLRARRRTGAVVGVNLGKTKLATDAVADYVASARRLAPLADYVVLNVSSPNTPGLRDLQAVAQLGELVRAVRPVLDGRPLLVKIAPDLSDEDVDAVAELALAERLDGIIATNTTITRDGLRSTVAEVEAAGAGGLSGAPVAARSLEVLRRLRARVGEEVVLVSVGGDRDAAGRLGSPTSRCDARPGLHGLRLRGPAVALQDASRALAEARRGGSRIGRRNHAKSGEVCTLTHLP